MKDNLIALKTHAFARQMVKAYQYIREKKEYNMSDQLVRSGTSVGAMVKEAEFAQSKADFINKMSIALKEANETEYWIEILHKSEYINDEQYDSIIVDCKEIIKLLIASINTLNKNNY